MCTNDVYQVLREKKICLPNSFCPLRVFFSPFCENNSSDRIYVNASSGDKTESQ